MFEGPERHAVVEPEEVRPRRRYTHIILIFKLNTKVFPCWGRFDLCQGFGLFENCVNSKFRRTDEMPMRVGKRGKRVTSNSGGNNSHGVCMLISIWLKEASKKNPTP